MEHVTEGMLRNDRDIQTMTGSLRFAPSGLFARARLVTGRVVPSRVAAALVALVSLALTASGCSITANLPADGMPPLTLPETDMPEGFESDSTSTQMVTTKIGGKNVFIPSTVVVAGGQSHTLSIYNTTDGAHGFRIDGLGIEVVLNPGVETEVDLGMLEGNRVYAIDCHLHPPHRTATLVVVQGR